VQLDEQTLAVVASGTHADVAPADGVITIGVWQGTTVPYTSDQYGSRVWIGTNRVALNSTSAAPNADAGNWNSSCTAGFQPATGSSDKATWVDSDMLTLDTHAAGSSATSNTIDVGGAPYTSALPGGAKGGLQLLGARQHGPAGRRSGALSAHRRRGSGSGLRGPARREDQRAAAGRRDDRRAGHRRSPLDPRRQASSPTRSWGSARTPTC